MKNKDPYAPPGKPLATRDGHAVPFVMWGTKAFHQLGDISRKKRSICTVTHKDKENYYGQWATGLGFFNVRFPKSTTCPLSKPELRKQRQQRYDLAGCVIGPFPKTQTYRK